MIEVVEPGPLSSIQDPIGRPGWRRYGVPVGGAADSWSAVLANRLAGNPDGSAVIEVTLGGAALRVDAPAVVAIAGGLATTIGATRLSGPAALDLPAGAILRLDPSDGARGYVAVAGGIAVEPVLGSASTDLRSGFGGHDGRALRAGDRLATGSGPSSGARRWDGHRPAGPIRVLEGPHPASLPELLAGTWTVGVDADRAGVRLDGSRLSGAEVPSMGLPLGAIQVPPDGRPIVMLADRPVTGGYAVPACVIRADVGRVAQLLPGDEVSFASVSLEEARRAWSAAMTELAAVASIDHDDELGWVGSHR